MKQKIGVLGGTFDPVHTSHLELAAAAQSEFNLNRVIFVPSAAPPHKMAARVSSFEHRVRMVEIACKLSQTFDCNPLEGQMPAPSYTIDTIKSLLSELGQENTLYFIVGCDAFLDILTWKSYREILNLVSILVSRRKGVDETELVDLARILDYNIIKKSIWSSSKGDKNIHFLKRVPADLSSTMIKKYLYNDLIVGKNIPKKVAEYIRENSLYK